MRYSIMLQLVSFLTVILLGAAAFFAWMQNRPASEQSRSILKKTPVSRVFYQ
jgi:flagellar basal body-associated protein FliL